MEPRLILVTWRDPTSYGGWQATSLALKAAICLSVGWELGENGDGDVILAATRQDNDFGDISPIPRCLITEIITLDKDRRNQ